MKSFRRSFAENCKGTCEGVSGAALSHIGCLTAPSIAGAVGGTLSHSFLMATMYVASPVLAVAITWGVDRIRGVKTSAEKLITSVAFAVVVSFGINQMAPHENHEHHISHEVTRDFYDSQTPEMQTQFRQSAEELGMSLDEYLEGFCISEDSSDVINQSQSQVLKF